MKRVFAPISVVVSLLSPLCLWASEASIVSYVERNLNDEVCYADFNHFFGCTQALDTFYSLSHGERLYPAHAKFKYLSKLYRLDIESRRDEGRFAWLKVKAQADYRYVAPSDAAAMSLKSYENLAKEWREVYEAEKARKEFSFTKSLADGIRSLQALSEKERTGMLVEAFSAYMKYARQDAHAYVLDAKEEQESNLQSGEAWIGIGMNVELAKRALIVAKIFPGSPAEKMGMNEGDEIVAVHGFTLEDAGKNPELLRKKIGGKEGEEAVFTVLRNGKRVELKGKYARIQTERVRARLITEDGVALGYLRLDEFSGFSTCLDFASQMRSLIAQGAKGWVLDLRGNPGGDVQIAKCLASYFLPKEKKITEFRFSDGTVEPIVLDGMGGIFSPNVVRADSMPMVTLVNATSASASEMLSSALRDYQRSLVVGERTFGKGCMQRGKPQADGDLLEFTTQALYLRPNGGSVQNLGVIPDFEVFATPRKAKERRAYHRREATKIPASIPNPFGEGEPVSFPRLENVKACLDKNADSDRKWYRDQPASTNRPDLQLRHGLRTVRCLMETGDSRASASLEFTTRKVDLEPLPVTPGDILPKEKPISPVLRPMPVR